MFISEHHLFNLYSRMPWDIRGNYYIHTGCLHTIGWWYVGNVHCVACVTVVSICSGWLCVTFVRTLWFTDCSLGSVHEQSMSHIPRFKGTQVYTDARQSHPPYRMYFRQHQDSSSDGMRKNGLKTRMKKWDWTTFTSSSSSCLLLFTVATLSLCTTNQTSRKAFDPRKRVHPEKSGSPHTPPVLHVLRTTDRKSNSWGSAWLQTICIVLPTGVVSQTMLAAALVAHVWSLSVGGVVQGEIIGEGEPGERVAGGQSGMHKLCRELALILLLYTQC